MRLSEQPADERSAFLRVEASAGHLELPRGARLVTRIDDQLSCLDEYFIATGRPPELQTFFRGVARTIFPRSITVALVVNDQVVGGFSVVRPPSPLIPLIPESVRGSLAFFHAHGEDEFSSISMVWLKKGHRGFVHSATLWLSLFIVLASCDCRFVLYNYSLAEEKNWRLYRRVTRSINVFDGMLTNGLRGGVEYIPVERLVRPTRFLDAFLNRHGGRRPTLC